MARTLRPRRRRRHRSLNLARNHPPVTRHPARSMGNGPILNMPPRVATTRGRTAPHTSDLDPSLILFSPLLPSFFRSPLSAFRFPLSAFLPSPFRRPPCRPRGRQADATPFTERRLCPSDCRRFADRPADRELLLRSNDSSILEASWKSDTACAWPRW